MFMLVIGFIFGLAVFISIGWLLKKYCQNDNEFKMGTVEPIFGKDGDYKMGFIRGFIKKYEDTPISKEETFNYLKTLIND